MPEATSTRALPLTLTEGRLAGDEVVLSDDALAFVAALATEFAPRVTELLARRRERQAQLDAGGSLRFLPETQAQRDADWKIAPVPPALADRRVEITGPVDRKMVINALNSGASVFMADFEDSNAPTWRNLVDGQRNLHDAVRGTITHVDATSGKRYALADRVATLMVRPRGWHLEERHASVGDAGGAPRAPGETAAVPAALFDFGLFFFHNAKVLADEKAGPFFYLPKMESHLEARLWNDVFVRAQERLGIPRGTIKATVLIETLPAAFEMDEILFELREHSAGLNCGRWDYIFSFIKKLRSRPECTLPDRGQVTMTQPFLRAYTLLLVKTCHRRGAHAMGGMAAQIPIKGDDAANQAAMDKVRADKLREVTDGHDGTWVAHPGLVPIAREIFDAHMPAPNQIDRQRPDVHVTAGDLCAVPTGTRTEAGLRQNVTIGIQYLEAWLRGVGCVPLHHLMEDAATAEISRSQVWQWLRHGAVTDDGRAVTRERFDRVLGEEVDTLRASNAGGASRLREASDLFRRLSTSETFEEFLTLPAYDLLLALEREAP